MTTDLVTFSTPGAGQWTVPLGVNQVTVIAVGGGGGGSSGVGGFGGGGGGLRRIVDMPVSAGEVLKFFVGNGGNGGSGGGYGADGESSWVKNNTETVTYIEAEGGKGGTANGVGGQGYGGTVTNAAVMTLTSTGTGAVAAGTDAPIAIYSTQSGLTGAENDNPPLQWSVSNLPTGVTVSSYRIHIEDLSTAGKFVHWHLTGISPTVTSISFGQTFGTITNNGATSGTVTWNTAGLTPGTYYYVCGNHPTSMNGQIVVTNPTSLPYNPVTKTYTVSASSSSAYQFTGNATGNNPTLNIISGDTLQFTLSSLGSHPFWIKTAVSSGSTNAITTLPPGASIQNTSWPSQSLPYVNSIGYGGPAPPAGKHNYRLTVSAILSGSSSVLVKSIEFLAGTGSVIPNQATATFADNLNVVTGSGVASQGGAGGAGSLLGYFSNLNGKAVVIDGGNGGNGGAPDYNPPNESPGSGGGGAAGYTNNQGAQGAYGKNSDGSFSAPIGGGGGGGNASKFGATGGGGVGVNGPGANGSTGTHVLLSTSISGATAGSGGTASNGVSGSIATFNNNTLQASGGGSYGGGGAGMQSSKGGPPGMGGIGAVSFSFIQPIITPNTFSFNQIDSAIINTAYESTTTSGGTTSNFVTISGLPAGYNAPITVAGTASGKAISISTVSAGAYVTDFTGLTVANGAQIRLKSNSSSNSSSSVYTRLTIGSAQADFIIVTQAVGGNIPSPLPQFLDVTDALISQVYHSNVVQISGLSAPGNVVLSGPAGFQVAVASTNAVNASGVLTGGTFGSSATVTNGQYLQLKLTSASSANTPVVGNITIASSAAISWSVTTGVGVDITPVPFTFTNIIDAITSPTTFYTAEREFGPAEFSADYDVPVTIVNFTAGATVSCRSTAPGATPGSFGSFPVNVRNGYKLEIKMDAAPLVSTVRSLQIKVGDYDVNPWTITTAASPDSIPNPFSFVNVTNSPPSPLLALASSNTITLTGFTVPITVTTSLPSGTGASSQPPLISVNGDTAQPGPRQINPNDSIRIDMPPSTALGTSLSITVTAGTVSAPFQVTTYATAPDTSNVYGQWYSDLAIIDSATRRKRKEDGLTIGTVISVTKSKTGDWGTLTGANDSRFPGFVECDGRYLDPAQYYALFKVIGNTYGGDAVETPVLTAGIVTGYTFTGKFRVPNYRNRKLAGVGRVDGNSAGSPGLTTTRGADPDSNVTGDIQTPGASGGQWFIDTIDAASTPPLEQVYDGTPNDTEGLFWKLGNLSTAGYSQVQGQVQYTIAGNMNVSIGPLNESLTAMPGHQHAAVTSIPNDVSGYSVVRWGINAMTGWTRNSGAGNTMGSPSCSVFKFFAPANQQSYDPSKTIAPPPSQGYPTAAQYLLALFDIEYQGEQATRYMWWQNNFGAENTHKINTVPLDNSSGNCLAALAILQGNASVQLYNPEGGQITHSHYIKLDDDYGTQANHFGYGNSTGGGHTVGIPTPQSNVTVEFQQANLGISANDATFQLSNAKQLTPTVTLSPQKSVSLMNKYSRTRYLIKAF